MPSDSSFFTPFGLGGGKPFHCNYYVNLNLGRPSSGRSVHCALGAHVPLSPRYASVLHGVPVSRGLSHS